MAERHVFVFVLNFDLWPPISKEQCTKQTNATENITSIFAGGGKVNMHVFLFYLVIGHHMFPSLNTSLDTFHLVNVST